jgi:hypothetical protein
MCKSLGSSPEAPQKKKKKVQVKREEEKARRGGEIEMTAPADSFKLAVKKKVSQRKWRFLD